MLPGPSRPRSEETSQACRRPLPEAAQHLPAFLVLCVVKLGPELPTEVCARGLPQVPLRPLLASAPLPGRTSSRRFPRCPVPTAVTGQGAAASARRPLAVTAECGGPLSVWTERPPPAPQSAFQILVPAEGSLLRSPSSCSPTRACLSQAGRAPEEAGQSPETVVGHACVCAPGGPCCSSSPQSTGQPLLARKPAVLVGTPPFR